MSEHHLEQLFKSCDRNGKGKIGPFEFRELCSEYCISPSDSDTIFNDLDRDGKGEVTFDDFVWGFREFLTPGARRVSMQFARATLEPETEPAFKAWHKLVKELGGNSQDALVESGQQLAAIHEELLKSEASPHLISCFEIAIRSLLTDVESIQEDNKKIEVILAKEKEAHLSRLQGLEAELESQVSHIKAQARAEALKQYKLEKETIISRMRDEMNELQTHLKLFHKLNTLLTRNSDQLDNQNTTSENIVCENLELKNALSDTKTNLTLVQSEMAILRSAYEVKCRQLHSHLEHADEFRSQSDNVHYQLSLLQEANTRLQDTNDSLLSSSDVWQPGRSHSNSQIGSNQEPQSSKRPSKSKLHTTIHAIMGMDFGDVDENYQFKVRRLMEDLNDSGLSMHDSSCLDSREISLHEELIPFTKSSAVDDVDSFKLLNESQLDLSTSPDRSFKIVFAGDASVGKSCFIHRICKGMFINNIGSTVGVDFHVKTIRVDGVTVALQLWDTAGQERFRSMTKSYFRRADGVVLLYDVGSEKSFKNVRQWIECVEEATSVTKLPVLLCGNKVDLREDNMKQVPQICVSTEQGAKLAREYGAIFLETSSMMGINVIDAIANLTREMLAIEDLEVRTSALTISAKPREMKSESACCR